MGSTRTTSFTPVHVLEYSVFMHTNSMNRYWNTIVLLYKVEDDPNLPDDSRVAKFFVAL